MLGAAPRRALLGDGGSWSVEQGLGRPTASARVLRTVLAPAARGAARPGDRAAAAGDRPRPAGRRPARALGRAAASSGAAGSATAVREVRAAQGAEALLKVLPVDPASRVPERRAVLTPYRRSVVMPRLAPPLRAAPGRGARPGPTAPRGRSPASRSRRCARSGWSRTAGGRRARCAATTSSWCSPTAATRSSSAAAAAGAGTGSGPERGRDGRRPIRRAARPLGLLLPRRRLDAGGAGRRRGRARLSGLALTDHDGVWGSMEFAHACKGLGVRPITGAELTVAWRRVPTPAAAHLTLLVESRGRLPQPLPAAHRRPLPHPRQHAAGRDAAVGDARAGRGARGGARLPLGLRPRRRCWRAPGSAARPPRGEALARRLLGGLRARPLPGRAAAPLLAPRPGAQPLARAASPSGSACPASPPATSTPTTAAAPACRTPSSRSAWGRRWRSPSRAAAATRPRRSPRRGGWPRASPSTPRRSPRPCASPSGCASTSPRSSATATPAPRTPAPTASSPRPAGRGWSSATPGSAHRREAERRLEEELATIRNLGLSGFFLLHRDLLELAREVARRGARARSRRARSCRRAAAAAPASARSSAT